MRENERKTNYYTEDICSLFLTLRPLATGAKESDYTIDEDLNKLVEESQKKQQQQQKQQQEDCDNSAAEEGPGERRKEGESEDTSKRKEEEGAGGEKRSSKEDGGGTLVGTLSFISCGAGSEVGSPGSPSDKEPEGAVLVCFLFEEAQA